MSIFNNPDFLTLKPLDLENKLFLPTSKLYDQTVWQLNRLYQEIKEALVQFHGSISVEAERFYDHPVDTATAWYEQALGYGANIYAAVSEEIFPKVEATYQHVIADVAEFGKQGGEFWRTFYDNPEAVTVSVIESVATQFNVMVDTSEVFIDSSLESMEAYLVGCYSTVADLLNLLLEQPGTTLMALYQNTLSALLDSYFELVSMLLTIQ